MKDSGIIPIWERYLMTVIEASEYYHIGENKLRNIIELFEDFLSESSVL